MWTFIAVLFAGLVVLSILKAIFRKLWVVFKWRVWGIKPNSLSEAILKTTVRRDRCW